jgi:hypothetical protein
MKKKISSRLAISADIETTTDKPIDLTAFKRGPSEKRPELYNYEELFLDPENPRLAEVNHTNTQGSILGVMEKEYDLQPIIDSLYKNGYFWEEPIVAVREALNEFGGKKVLVVIEGNRRLASLKMIHANPATYKDAAARKRLLKVPVLVRGHRDETLAFVGFRHITGVKPWEAAAKAQYALGLVRGGNSIEAIADIIGDKTKDIGRWVRTQSLIETAAQIGMPTTDVTSKSFFFSYLLTATDSTATKKWLELTLDQSRGTVTKINEERLKELWIWLYGSKSLNASPVVSESRQIHSLNRVLAVPEAVQELKASGNLDRAESYTKSRESYIAEVLAAVRSKLQDLLAVVAPEGELLENLSNRKEVRLAREEYQKLERVLSSLKESLKL